MYKLLYYHNQLFNQIRSRLNKKKQEVTYPKPPLPTEKLIDETTEENKTKEDIEDQIVEEKPEIVESKLDDFESRLKRLTGDD